jgi:hypothetical protein
VIAIFYETMISAVVMVGEGGGKTEPEVWVQDARRAATVDLIDQLEQESRIDQIYLITPSISGLEGAHKSIHIESQPGPVHVGQHLAELVEQTTISKLLYFGGGSAPLLDNNALGAITAQMSAVEDGVFTNNRHASDWAGVVPASKISEWQERIPQDNMMGWVLSTEAKLPVFDQPVSAASRLDIDTPVDLLTLRLHPMVKPNLRRFLNNLPLDTTSLVKALEVLSTPATHVFVGGRIGPSVWAAVNALTNSWFRVFSEERGMVSSGRLERGEVFSILANYISEIGISGFFEQLSQTAQAAFIDTRVLMAHHRSWPRRSDRFASDLGLAHRVGDPWLQEFTSAAHSTSIPIILGGHGLLSGDMLALCELL